MRIILFAPVLLYFLWVNDSYRDSNKSNSEIKLPVMVTFSKSVPDSVRDFVRVYLKLKKVRVITLEQAAEIFLEQEKETLLKNVPTDKDNKEQFLSKIETGRKALYNILRTEMYASRGESGLIIDSLKWYAIQPGSSDTSKKWKTFIPSNNIENCMIIWKNLVDTIIQSGALK